MRLLLGLVFVGIAAGQTVCGRETEEAAVYCMPDLRQFGPMLPGPRTQVWVRYQHPLNQVFFARVQFRFGAFSLWRYAILQGWQGVAVGSFDSEGVEPVRVDYWDFDRWEMRTILP